MGLGKKSPLTADATQPEKADLIRYDRSPSDTPCQGALRVRVDGCDFSSAMKTSDGDAGDYILADSRGSAACGEEAMVCGWSLVCACSDGGSRR